MKYFLKLFICCALFLALFEVNAASKCSEVFQAKPNNVVSEYGNTLEFSFGDLRYEHGVGRGLVKYLDLNRGQTAPKDLNFIIEGKKYRTREDGKITDEKGEIAGYFSLYFIKQGYQSNGVKITINKGPEYDAARRQHIRSILP